ncbi:protein kinase [bacterium AH-315-J21]|nr:protein kinase [bacterium AH-315-J21]
MAQFQVGKYRSVRELGSGGMARVFLAVNTETDENVALKVSRQSVTHSREALKNEFLTYQRLDHSSFPNVLELIEDDDRLIMVMDYLEGETLEELLTKGSIAPSYSMKLMLDISSAMSHAGEKGVIHTDLKPANIIIHDDNIKIIDFGLASGASTLTAEDIKQIAGTLNYFSPEQADGRSLDIRTDIFSAGVILYELLTGKRPFEQPYDMATLYSIMYEEAVPPSKLNANLGSVVDTLLQGMLEKQAEDRYPDFAAVTSAIEAISGNIDASSQKTVIPVTVFPFQMRQSNSDDELFVDGITDELIALLGQLENVEVTPFMVIKHRFEEGMTPEIVRTEFGSDFLLTGTIMRASQRIRVSVALLDTSTSKTIWREKYDSPVTDIFDLQDLICAQITSALKVELIQGDEKSKTSHSTENVQAYEFYLKGRNYLTRNTREDMEFAQSMLENAIAIDPQYPLAYAGLADLHGSRYMNYFDRSMENWERGIVQAQKSIDLDSSKPNGFRAYGRLLHLRGRYDEAIEYLSRAVTLDSKYAEAYRTLAWANEGKGDLPASLAWTRKALSIDSQSEETILLQGMLYYDLDSMPQAINAFRRCLELRPDYGRAHYFMARSFQKMGRFDEALSGYTRAKQYGGQPEIYLDYGWLLHCLGKNEIAIEVLLEACGGNQQKHLAHCYLGMLFGGLGREVESRENFAEALKLSTQMIGQGDDSSYPVIVNAISLIGLGREGEADKLYRRVVVSPEVSGNGELAILCARFCSRRGWEEETKKWLSNALSWRLGFSEVEALVDPAFSEFHGYMRSVAASSAA